MVLVMKAPGFSWTFVFTPFCPAKKRRGATRSPDQSNMHDPVSLWHVEPDPPPPPPQASQALVRLTFSPEAPVRTKVEKTGSEYLVLAGQHSMVAPMGRQKRGTDSGRGNDS